MTGSLQVKKGYYYTVIYVTQKDGKSKPVWKSTGLSVKSNKRKAEQILRERITEYEKLGGTMTKDMLFTDFMREWLEIIKPQIKESTYYQYSLIVNNSVIPYFERLKVKLTNLESVHIQGYYTQKQKSGLSGNTIKHHHANIRKALNYALKSNWIVFNPADRVELPKVKEFRAKYLEDTQIKILINTVKGTDIETPVLLAAVYGFRRSEVLGLKWDAIDFKEHTVTVKHTVVPSVRGLLCEDSTKNKSSTRTLRLIPAVENHLKKVVERQREMSELLGCAYIKNDYVCTLDSGALIKPDYLTRHFKALLTSSDLPVIRFHDLRHSSASLLIATGHSLKEVGEWLGHSCITTTNRYAHLQYQTTVNMANVVDDKLFHAS